MTQILESPNRLTTPVLFSAAAVLAVPVIIHFLVLATTDQSRALPPGLFFGAVPAVAEVEKGLEFWSTDFWSKQIAIPCILALSIVLGLIPGTLASKWRDYYYRFLKVTLTATMGLLIIPVTMQILSRYTGIIPRYIWTEEIARFCFIWIVLLGAMIAVEDDSHFDVDLLPTPTTLQGRGWAKLVVHLALLTISVNFVIFGYDFTETAIGQHSEISGLPMWLIYIGWPMAGVTWTVFLTTKTFEDYQRIRGIKPLPDILAEQASERLAQSEESVQ